MAAKTSKWMVIIAKCEHQEKTLSEENERCKGVDLVN